MLCELAPDLAQSAKGTHAIVGTIEQHVTVLSYSFIRVSNFRGVVLDR